MKPHCKDKKMTNLFQSSFDFSNVFNLADFLFSEAAIAINPPPPPFLLLGGGCFGGSEVSVGVGLEVAVEVAVGEGTGSGSGKSSFSFPFEDWVASHIFASSESSATSFSCLVRVGVGEIQVVGKISIGASKQHRIRKTSETNVTVSPTNLYSTVILIIFFGAGCAATIGGEADLVELEAVALVVLVLAEGALKLAQISSTSSLLNLSTLHQQVPLFGEWP